MDREQSVSASKEGIAFFPFLLVSTLLHLSALVVLSFGPPEKIINPERIQISIQSVNGKERSRKLIEDSTEEKQQLLQQENPPIQEQHREGLVEKGASPTDPAESKKEAAVPTETIADPAPQRMETIDAAPMDPVEHGSPDDGGEGSIPEKADNVDAESIARRPELPTSPVIHEFEALSRGLNLPAPVYPRRAARLKQEGSCLVEITIAVDGSVEFIEFIESSGFPLLDKAVQDTISSSWKFHSGTTKRVTRKRFVFQIDEE